MLFTLSGPVVLLTDMTVHSGARGEERLSNFNRAIVSLSVTPPSLYHSSLSLSLRLSGVNVTTDGYIRFESTTRRTHTQPCSHKYD